MSAPPPVPDIPIEGKTIKTLIVNHLKRTHHMFSTGVINEEHEEMQLRESCVPFSFALPEDPQVVPTGAVVGWSCQLPVWTQEMEAALLQAQN